MVKQKEAFVVFPRLRCCLMKQINILLWQTEDDKLANICQKIKGKREKNTCIEIYTKIIRHTKNTQTTQDRNSYIKNTYENHQEELNPLTQTCGRAILSRFAAYGKGTSAPAILSTGASRYSKLSSITDVLQKEKR